MIILHIASISGNKHAGPTTNVPLNVIYCNKKEKSALFNCTPDVNLSEFIPNKMVFNISKYKKISELPNPFNTPDIVVFHGLYSYEFIPLAKELCKKKTPYVIVPRGSMTKDGQKKKKIKKIIGNILFFKHFVKNASSINFLTDNEYIESKKCFKFQDYYINGNGTQRKNTIKIFNNNKNKDNFVITFIGRIDVFHKGLDLLVESIASDKDYFVNNKVMVNIYGPGDQENINKLKSLIEKFEIENLVKLKGSVFDSDKEKVLLATDLFIHTSRLEGQPTSVIEAISYGIPVFVTPGTNVYKMVEDNNLGFVSKFDKNDIKDNLIKAIESKEKFDIISKNEKKYSDEHFSWDTIVDYNIENYKKIIERG